MPDVTPPERSIRNIPVPEGRKHIEPMPQEIDRTSEKRRGGGKIWLWAGVVVVICAVAGILISTVFAGATITVNPRTATVTPPSSVLAGLNAPAGSLGFKAMTVSQSAQKTLPANGTEQASSSAQGTITIFNEFSAAPQELIATTRFEAPDGKIYRIHQGVVVPGSSKNADGSVKPGSITATVYADKAGAEYNRAAETRFTIPGFKNTTKYTKFYAIAPTVSGGFVGTQPAVVPADKARAESDLKQQLQTALQESANSEIPEGYIAIPSTLSIVYEDLKTTDAGGGNATLSISGTASEAVVRSADLASAIARLGVQGYNGEVVDFEDPSGITISIASSTPYSPSATSLALALSGTANLVWQFDQKALQEGLADKPRSQFDQIVSSFAPAIAKATASLRPFWKNTFPAKAEDIKIKIESAS